MGSKPIFPQGMKMLASPLFIWLALSFAGMVSSRYLLLETEDGADEYSVINENSNKDQKAVVKKNELGNDYCASDYGIKPRMRMKMRRSASDYGIKPRMRMKKRRSASDYGIKPRMRMTKRRSASVYANE